MKGSVPLAILISAVVLLGCLYLLFTFFDNSGEMRVCPDAWFENNMPRSDKYGEQYFLVNDKRAELVDYDVDWIQKTCSVNKPQKVY